MQTGNDGRKANNAMSNLMQNTIGRRLLNSKQLAVYIGTSEAGVYQMVSRRQVPFLKIGRSTRFDLRAIDAWIEHQSVPPVDPSRFTEAILGDYQEAKR